MTKGKIYGSREKNEERGGGIRQKREETSPEISLLVGVNLIFQGEGGLLKSIH